MASNSIRFEGYHLPGLQAGLETIEATLDFKIPAAPSATLHNTQVLRVQISAPRFMFSPAELFASFPPRDSFGEWDNVLPHVELTPSTLPWKRRSGADDQVLPWLALILLQEEESSDPTKVITEKIAWEKVRDELALTKEATDHASEGEPPFPPVRVLRIDGAFLTQLMPTSNDLHWLTHVRVAPEADGVDVERAIVVCNRMPRKDARATIHLISLEERFKSDGTFDMEKGAKEGKIPLLSLHSWQFMCLSNEQFKVSDRALGRLNEPLKSAVAAKFPTGEDRDTLYRGRESFMTALDTFNQAEKDALLNACHIQSETFKGLMDALDFGWLRVPQQTSAHGVFQLGGVPVAHGQRHGGKSVSWYHGPLIADKNFDAEIQTAIMGTLPIRNADQLLIYNETTQMLDASYAAAWELGRLLAISEPQVSQRIAQWKSSHARKMALVEQNLFFSHIPFTDSQFVHREGGEIEQHLQAYFTELSHLHGIPFQYLVPHEALLPDESLRFFYVDQLWVDCLLDGAFSIGRITRSDEKRERGAQGQLNFPHQQERPIMSGVILRSDLVAGWPSLMVEGYRSANPSESNKLDLVRYEPLGKNVSIAIFHGELKSFILHLPPESLHFGFSRDASDEDGYYKEVKDLADGNELPTIGGQSRRTYVNFGWRPGAEALRIFVPERMIANINSRLSDGGTQDKVAYEKVTHSGHLGIELLEGVPRLQVTIK